MYNAHIYINIYVMYKYICMLYIHVFVDYRQWLQYVAETAIALLLREHSQGFSQSCISDSGFIWTFIWILLWRAEGRYFFHLNLTIDLFSILFLKIFFDGKTCKIKCIYLSKSSERCNGTSLVHIALSLKTFIYVGNVY